MIKWRGGKGGEGKRKEGKGKEGKEGRGRKGRGGKGGMGWGEPPPENKSWLRPCIMLCTAVRNMQQKV
jgi:hypothetical protein